MKVDDLALVGGWPHTVATLRRWNTAPWRLLGAWALGTMLADLAWRLDVSPLALLVTLTPHSLPELVAVFLPLAAWSLASRRGAWDELLAATIATTAIAIPVLVLAGAVETWVTPRLLWGLVG